MDILAFIILFLWVNMLNSNIVTLQKEVKELKRQVRSRK